MSRSSTLARLLRVEKDLWRGVVCGSAGISWRACRGQQAVWCGRTLSAGGPAAGMVDHGGAVVDTDIDNARVMRAGWLAGDGLRLALTRGCRGEPAPPRVMPAGTPA